jgi:hypothetical protein
MVGQRHYKLVNYYFFKIEGFGFDNQSFFVIFFCKINLADNLNIAKKSIYLKNKTKALIICLGILEQIYKLSILIKKI